MQREAFFLSFLARHLRREQVGGRGRCLARRGKGGVQWLQGIWQSQRQHAANGRRKLYAKTMTKHTRQTERHRDRQTHGQPQRLGQTKSKKKRETQRERERCQQYAYNAKPQIKFRFCFFSVLVFCNFLQFFFCGKQKEYKTSLTNKWVQYLYMSV